MTDVHLRSLERRAAVEGTPEAEAACLRARLRVEETCLNHENYSIDPCPQCGGLTLKERIGLAAYCNSSMHYVQT